MGIEKTKKINRVYSTLLVALVFVFALFLTACGGEPIERQEALDALNNALSAEVAETVGDYEIKMTYKEKTNQDGTRTVTTQDSTLRVDVDTNVAYQTTKLQSTLNMEGAVKGELVTKASTEYYMGKIGDVTYRLNDKEKAYQVYDQDFEDYINYQTTLTVVSAPTEDELALEDITMELTKSGDGSYDLTFVFTQIEQSSPDADEEKTVTTKKYKIRDNKIKEYTINVKEYVANELETEANMFFEYDYGNVNLNLPTTSLEGYTEADFDISL